MLTLFKPWRSGLDLKSHEQTWDDAFQAHVFSAHENQIITNFNIRYECLDAHDDYHALLKAGKTQPPIDFWDPNDNSENDDSHSNTVHSEEEHQIMLNERHIQSINDHIQSLNKETTHIRSVLKSTGWTALPDPLEIPPELPHFTPDVKHTSHEWKSIVQIEKNNQISKSTQTNHCLPTPSYPNINIPIPNQVKIIDKHYLQMKFYTKCNQDISYAISSMFQLNNVHLISLFNMLSCQLQVK